MTEYVARLVSKHDGEERYKRVSAKAKSLALKKMSRYSYAPNGPMSKESWNNKMGKYWHQLTPQFKKMFGEVTYGHIQKVN